MGRKWVWIPAVSMFGVFLALAVAASVNLHGNIINADTGYQVNASAPSGYTLVGNGTVFVPQAPSSAVDDYVSASGCALTNSGNLGSCTGTFTFTPAMPDTNYMAFCVADSTTAMTVAVNTQFSAGKTTTSFDYSETELMQNSGSPMTPTLYCHLHDAS